MRGHRIARGLTEAGAPAVLLGLLPVVFAFATAPTPAAGFGWAVLSALFFAVLPFAWVLRGVIRGRLTDHHLVRREQRRGPLLVGVASMVIGWAVAAVGGAPRTLVAYLGVVLVQAAVAVAVTLAWKVSVHSWIAAIGATALIVVFGPWALLSVPAALAVAWSRLRLGVHTPAQVAVGLAAGFALTAALFPPLR